MAYAAISSDNKYARLVLGNGSTASTKFTPGDDEGGMGPSCIHNSHNYSSSNLVEAFDTTHTSHTWSPRHLFPLSAASLDSSMDGKSPQSNTSRHIVPHSPSIPIHGIDLHPNKPLVASVGWDGLCIIRRYTTGALLCTLKGHDSGLYAVEFDEDDLVATCSSDKTMRLWRINATSPTDGSEASYDSLSVFRGHDDEVNDLSFIRSTGIIATASDDQTVKLWDSKTGIAVSSLVKHTASVYGVCSQPLGGKSSVIASCGFDRAIVLWDIRSSKAIHQLLGHEDDIIGVSFSPGGTQLASGSDDRTCRLWDVRQMKCMASIDVNSAVKRVSFSPTGSNILTSCVDFSIKIWDTYFHSLVHKLEVTEYFIYI
jgi:dynein assembly factor with WDR repeat domains 1